jgi:DNA-binding Xre family transcriptional regulator
MRWNLRMKAAEAGIWQATDMRRRLAEAGLVISSGKMSTLWSGAPTTIRLDDLEVICAVLQCTPNDLLMLTGDVAAGRDTELERAAGQDVPPPARPISAITPSPGRPRSAPPL